MRERVWLSTLLAMSVVAACAVGAPSLRVDPGNVRTRSGDTDAGEGLPLDWIVGGVLGTSGGTVWAPPQWTERPATEEELAAKDQDAGPPPVNTTPTEETLAWAASLPPGQAVDIVVVLPDVAFDWTQMAGADDVTRAAIIAQRQVDLAPSQQAVIAKLVGLGATVRASLWVANEVQATTSSSLLSTIATWPEVLALEHDMPVVALGTVGDGYYGHDRRFAVRASPFVVAGYTGAVGGGSTGSGKVQLAAVGCGDSTDQTTRIPPSHPGFETSTSTTRVANDLECNSSTGLCTAAAAPTAQTHDTVVLGVMAGSIEAGQDPSFTGTGTPAQKDRSGISSGAVPSYYMSRYSDGGGGGCSSGDMALGLQTAYGDGAQIINCSWGLPGAMTDPSVDYSGINEIFQNIIAGDSLVVVAGGDANLSTFSASCNQLYPANRPEVVTVNGYASVYDSSGNAPAAPSMEPAAWSTSGCPVDVYTGSTYASRPNISLGPLAPGDVGLSYYWDSASSFGYSGNKIGSSFAAPVVAGAGALLADAFYANGLGLRPGYWLKSDLMMLTDGFAFSSYTGAQTGRLAGGISPYSGTGRLLLHYPASGSFTTAGWSWTWGSGVFIPGEVYERNIPADIEHYRLAFYWQEPDLTHASDIDVYLDGMESDGTTVCSGSFAFQADYSLNNAIHIQASDVPACAVYVRIRIVVYAMPSGQTRRVYNSDLYDYESTF